MRTLTITRYTELTSDQWRRVAATARKHVRRVTGLRSEVGIGRKWSAGQPRDNGIAVRVHLPTEKRPVPTSRRVPEAFLIRLRRGDGGYVRLRIRSDVDSLADYAFTAGRVDLQDQSATTALVLRWVDRRQAVRWGFATVAHLFGRAAPRAVSVRVGSAVFRCRRLRPPPRSDRNDVCLLAINGPSDRIEPRLIDCGVLQPKRSAPLDLMTVRQVHASAVNRVVGRTFSIDGSESVVGEEVFPDGFRLGTRRVDDCVRVSAAVDDTFRPGTSGAVWTFGNRVACMQLGGRRPVFREGIGQPLSRYLRWFERTLGDQATVVAVLDRVIGGRASGHAKGKTIGMMTMATANTINDSGSPKRK